ncbi:MAG: glycerol-3-phosphate 1-O-acyltransferase PlsY [Tumebacillaceae bacterium]
MTVVIILIVSYLIGSIPSALIVGKLGYGVDIRQLGSGNLGGTNTFRSLGKRAGMVVTVADVLKGTLAASLPVLLGSDLHLLIAGVPAVLGHCYPIFANFRGGKAVATSGGVLLAYSPLFFVFLITFFFIVLYLSKYVSLASMLTAVFAHTYGILMGDKLLSLMTFVLCLLVLYRHRSNVERIMAGTERKITWL